MDSVDKSLGKLFAAVVGVAGISAASCLGGAFMAESRYPDKPITNISRTKEKEVETYDINGDGLEDVILPNGSVKIKTIDGTYTTLYDQWAEEVRDLSVKYSLKKQPDGRYVAGVSE